MDIHPFPSGPFETNAYVVVCPETQAAAIIDPAPGSFEKIRDFLVSENLEPSLILLTHTHWDHIGDAAKTKDAYDIPVLVHPLDAPNLQKPGEDLLPMFMEIEGVQPDRLIEEGDRIELGHLRFDVIETPGHTPGGVCFYEKNQGVLISGDTLFRGSIGNLSFPTCDAGKMWTSLDKLAELPKETNVYPGHGPSTTIGEEKWLPEARKYFEY